MKRLRVIETKRRVCCWPWPLTIEQLGRAETHHHSCYVGIKLRTRHMRTQRCEAKLNKFRKPGAKPSRKIERVRVVDEEE